MLRSPLLTAAGVPHAFSTRAGGVSGGVFASLNLGNPSDLPPDQRDTSANIAENWRRVLAAAGLGDRRRVEVHQVHGGSVYVVRVGEPRQSADTSDLHADAVVSDDPGVVLAVRVADCCPVLLASPDGRVVAAVHAGWRGVLAGVIPAAVRSLREFGAGGCLAALGPTLCPEHFEIGPEVATAFVDAFASDLPVRPAPAPGRFRLDLAGAICGQLQAAGVRDVDVLGRCTWCEPDLFFSHRRDGGRTGRSAGVIGPRA